MSARDPDAATPVLAGTGLRKVLDGEIPTTLIADVDLAVAPGEFVAITGPSGSGKSSLLYLLGLLDVPSAGEVLVDGRPTASLPEEERAAIRLCDLGFVFQFHFLLPEFTARDNVALPMRALRLTQPRRASAIGLGGDGDIMRRADDILASLGLADHRHKRPDQMSGGQRQRVAVARALGNQPRIILADEPTGNLDTASTDQVFRILRGLADEAGTAGDRRAIVMVTHEPALAARADRRVHIVDGRIASDVRQVQPGEVQAGAVQAGSAA